MCLAFSLMFTSRSFQESNFSLTKVYEKSDRIFLLYFCFHITVKSSIFWLPPSPLQIVDYILSVNSTENKYRTKGVLFFWSFYCCSQQVVGLYFTSCSFTLVFNAGSKHSFPPTASQDYSITEHHKALENNAENNFI